MNQAYLLVSLALVWSQVDTSSAQANGDIRLVDGSSTTTGRLEIYLGGSWGTVCYDMNSPGAAQAACRQLGFSDYIRVDTVTNMGIKPGTAPIKLHNVDCILNGGDQHILRCSFSQETSSCQHSMDMAISCSSSPISPYDGAVRLVDGGTGFLSSGTAEVYLNNQWGTMCDYEIDNDAASTICRQLGYTSATDHSYSPTSSTRVWLDTVSCLGSQPCLSECFTYPSAAYYPSCSNVAVVNCTFGISEDFYDAGSEALCTSYLYLVNNLKAIIIGCVVAFFFVCFLFILVPILICCCCIQGCLLHSCRERRVVYQVIQ